MESVASLKDPTKIVEVAPDMLLADYRDMVQEVQQRIGFFHDLYFKDAVSALSRAEMDELEQFTDSCCEMIQDFMKQLKDAAEPPRG